MKKKNLSREELLDRILKVVRENPGIRAMEIGEAVGKKHTWNYRKALIEKGLIRKERDGAAVRYYPVINNKSFQNNV